MIILFQCKKSNRKPLPETGRGAIPNIGDGFTPPERSHAILCKKIYISSKPFPSDKYAGIGEAARDAVPCSEGRDAKQSGPQSSGLSASQSAHTGLAPV